MWHSHQSLKNVAQESRTDLSAMSFTKKVIIIIAYLTFGMLGIYITFFDYTILNFAQLYHMNSAIMGLMIGTQYVGMAIPPLFLGVLSAKIGKKKVVLISCLLLVTGTFLLGMAINMTIFIMAVLFTGAGFAVTEATLSAILADEFTGKSVQQLNFSQAVFSIGALADRKSVV
jgi:MFS family permease